ncbi:MAG: glycosyltransferase [Deltaproteobacteria bacterium]|nr:glycosyltransferase [Deltaproteobacteria bacterium]
MHVALVLMKYNPYGGYERQASLLADYLLEQGMEVTVFSSSWPDHLQKNIQFVRVPLIHGSAFLKVLSFALFSQWRLLQFKKHIDCVIAFDRTFVIPDVYRAGNACHREWLEFRKKRAKFRDFLSLSLNLINPVINFVESKMFAGIKKKEACVVTLSSRGCAQIQRHFSLDSDLFRVIAPAIKNQNQIEAYRALKRTEFRNKFSLKSSDLVLLHVGSGFDIKGLDQTIAALSLLPENLRRKTYLMVVGRNSKRLKYYKQLCADHAVLDRVKFVGGVSNIEDFYSMADIFVLPSLFETFCVSVLEALSYGLPVIIGEGAGITDLLQIKEITHVIPVPANPKLICDLIEKIYNEEVRVSSKSLLESRKVFSAAFEYQSVMGRWTNLIYEKCTTRYKQPKMSVIIGAYNNLDYLKLCLYSLERQSFRDFEVIIADDGSGPEVKQWLSTYEPFYKLKHVWQEDDGFRKCRILNKSIQEARSEYLVFLIKK